MLVVIGQPQSSAEMIVRRSEIGVEGNSFLKMFQGFWILPKDRQKEAHVVFRLSSSARRFESFVQCGNSLLCIAGAKQCFRSIREFGWGLSADALSETQGYKKALQ